MENGQCYSEFEEFYNIIASFRADLLKYVDKNLNDNNFNMGLKLLSQEVHKIRSKLNDY